jgi:hypothetical protein
LKTYVSITIINLKIVREKIGMRQAEGWERYKFSAVCKISRQQKVRYLFYNSYLSILLCIEEDFPGDKQDRILRINDTN